MEVTKTKEVPSMSNNDVETLKAIAAKSPTARFLAEYFASRERNRDSVNVPKTKRMIRKSGKSINDEHADAFFKGLADAGYGRVKVKAKRAVRFYNLHPVYQLGKAILEGTPLEAAPAVKPKAKKSRKATKKTTKPVLKTKRPKKRRQLSLNLNPVGAPKSTTRTILISTIKGAKVRLEVEGDISMPQVEAMLAQLSGPIAGSA